MVSYLDGGPIVSFSCKYNNVSKVITFNWLFNIIKISAIDVMKISPDNVEVG